MYMHYDDDDSELIDEWEELLDEESDGDLDNWSFYDLLDDDLEFRWSEMSYNRFEGAM